MQEQSTQYQGQTGDGQLQDKVQETAQNVSEQAKQMGGQVQSQVKDQISNRSTQAGDQVSSITEGIRKMGEHFQSQGQDGPSRVTEQAAQRADKLANYLRQSDADTILHDVESFGRRQPWALVAGGIAVGFLASRFLKASASRRSQGGASNGGRLPDQYPTYGSRYPTAPAVTTYEERGDAIQDGYVSADRAL